ncbi:MAG TPA: hypothetical protein PK228_12840 [Saprospiraceae bacterium]|nr:hypothetical protein [Saprospiraceae bacterium]
MAKEDIAPYQRNLALKQEFKLLGLDLAEVMEFSPFDLDLENRRLDSLLDFVHRFSKYGSQQAMEAIEGTFLFPPIFPGIDPDSDWYRFELWMQGQPTRMTLAEQLPKTFVLKKPEELTDEEIVAALEQLEEAMFEAGYGISLNEGIPPRLVYEYLVESLGETFELGPGGGWHLDGCTGYCPDCFQRPWCDTGQSSCWSEDEEAGKMSLTDTLSPYVCASPHSLEILQRLQAEKDADFEKFKAENPDLGLGESDFEEDRKARSN